MNTVFDAPELFIRRDRPQISAQLGAIVCCAGYGKTSYLSQLSASNPGSVCLSLKAYDDSPDRICAVMKAAIPALTGCNTGFETVLRFAAEMAVRETPLVLIDNADVVRDQTALAFLDFLCMAALDGKFRLLMTGRGIPGFLLSYLMNGRATLYGVAEMRLTKAETENYLQLRGRHYDEKYLNTLYAFTGGWCVGVSALAGVDGAPADSVGKTLLEAYIENNIMLRLNPELVEYLRLTAFIDAHGEDFAARVFGIDDGGLREDRLVTQGVLARDENGSVVFPEAMRAIFAFTLSEEKKRLIMDRASSYYITEKRFAEAIKLFDASANAAAAERILKNYGDRFLANYEFELIGYCGNIIEKNRGTTDPEVLGILAQYFYYCGDHAKMEAAYNLADSMFGKENKYSVYRKLYKGLLRYEGNKELYSLNVKSACEYLETNMLPMPFLHQQELDTLTLIRSGSDDSGKLRIYRFGTLRLSVGDAEIQCKSRKSIELIAYMLENEGRPIPREDLLNMLWHDNIPSNAVAMLHNIIYGLRRELTAYGLENVIIYRNKCYMLDMSMIVEDDREIIETCKAAEAADKKKLASHEAVLEKYWGRYLGTSDSRDSQEQKEYYDHCFVKASLMAAELCKENQNREKEMLFLKNALELDPYSEQIVCSYILCCFAIGKPDKAKRTYDEYAKLIDEELGITPSLWLKKEFLSGFSNDA